MYVSRQTHMLPEEVVDSCESVFTGIVGKYSTINIVVELREEERCCRCVPCNLPHWI